jgi:hypothetical protein
MARTVIDGLAPALQAFLGSCCFGLLNLFSSYVMALFSQREFNNNIVLVLVQDRLVSCRICDAAGIF